ncbi:MAG: sigma-70 family RNA polymerase sigma factor [Kangiellaceae bacterium]|nr:sigma-70 family RNA polymerase sigma factor [Kangiellaceae bacterium]
MSQESLFHKIYFASRAGISRVISRMVPPHEVEDIVQETYVKICQIDNKDRIESPKSFMYKTARNLALDYLKHSNNQLVDRVNNPNILESLLADDELDEMYEQALIQSEFSHFCDAVRQLPTQCRRVFVLRKVYGCTQKEIATQLSVSESTVEKHIAKGMKQCTLYMKQQHATDSVSRPHHNNTMVRG